MPDSGSSFTHTVLVLHKPSSLPSLALPPSNMQVRNGDLGYTGSSAEAFVTDLSARKRFLRLEVKLAAGMRLFKANASEIFIETISTTGGPGPGRAPGDRCCDLISSLENALLHQL